MSGAGVNGEVRKMRYRPSAPDSGRDFGLGATSIVVALFENDPP